MKKQMLKILMLGVMFIIACMLPVKAADATVSLNPSKTKVYAGDTFTVTFNVACDEGINGLESIFSYDENKLELIKLDIIDTLKWSLLNEEVEEGLNLGIMSNSSSTITSADILKLTFKVKDTATEEAKAKITFADIVMGSDAGTNSLKQIGTKEVQISILERLEVNITEFEQGQEGANKYINKINIGILLEKLLEKIQTNGLVEIFKDNIKITDNNAKLATGMEVKVSLNDEVIKYKVVVKGDTNGDGDATFNDILQINKHRLNKVNLTGEHLKAADITGDGIADFKDILQINKYRLKKISNL